MLEGLEPLTRTTQSTYGNMHFTEVFEVKKMSFFLSPMLNEFWPSNIQKEWILKSLAEQNDHSYAQFHVRKWIYWIILDLLTKSLEVPSNNVFLVFGKKSMVRIFPGINNNLCLNHVLKFAMLP